MTVDPTETRTVSGRHCSRSSQVSSYSNLLTYQLKIYRPTRNFRSLLQMLADENLRETRGGALNLKILNQTFQFPKGSSVPFKSTSDYLQLLRRLKRRVGLLRSRKRKSKRSDNKTMNDHRLQECMINRIRNGNQLADAFLINSVPGTGGGGRVGAAVDEYESSRDKSAIASITMSPGRARFN